ncbi:MAG: helix-turn-helix domain-containing protein [Pseudomonadota bacterium]
MAEELQASVTEESAGRNQSRVGALLRAAREGKGRDLASVSQQLRIRAVYLRAIEDGDFGALPGTTYAVGFVRSYADYLGLNGPDIVRRFREEVEELGRRTQLVFPSTPAEGKIPGGAILLLAVVIAAIAYGAWFYMSDRDRSLAGLIPEVPAELKAVLNGNSQAATTTGAAPLNAPSGATTTAAAPADAVAANPAPASTEAPAASANAPEAAAETQAASTDGGRAETTAGVATAADARAAETINLAPAPSADTAGTAEEEDQVPAAPDNADAATRAATQGMPPAAEETPPSLEGATAATAPVAAPPTTAATATASAATSGAATAAGTSSTGSQQAAVPTPPAPPAAPMPPEESLPKGQDYGVANGEARVVLVARQESWVQVSSANQEVWTRVLRPGDRYLVPNDPTLTLSTGNAGGLDILVDGRKISSLGPVGVVRRGISLDPKRLLDGTAIP